LETALGDGRDNLAAVLFPALPRGHSRDGLPAHRSRLVQGWAAGQRGRLELERLPAYAPELNPVEYIWGYWKQHELPNFCPKNFAELSYQARRALRRMRRRPSLIRSFWRQAQLF
jgi:transposase